MSTASARARAFPGRRSVGVRSGRARPVAAAEHRGPAPAHNAGTPSGTERRSWFQCRAVLVCPCLRFQSRVSTRLCVQLSGAGTPADQSNAVAVCAFEDGLQLISMLITSSAFVHGPRPSYMAISVQLMTPIRSAHSYAVPFAHVRAPALLRGVIFSGRPVPQAPLRSATWTH